MTTLMLQRRSMIAPLAAVLLTLSAAAAAAVDAPPPPAPGTLIDAKRVKWYPALWFRIALLFVDLPGRFPVESGARLYRVRYWTLDHRGETVVASGLVATPNGRDPRAVVMYLHGTTTERTYVPSAPNVEGKLAAAIFAGARYLVVAPDYLGLGASEGLHPYLHAQSAVHASVDLLRAARALCAARGIAWPAAVNLFGVSQGGHTAAALHRHLESIGDGALVLRATATVGAPFDLAGVAFPFALEGTSGSHRVYLAAMVRAYSAIYARPIDSVVREPYASLLPILFDGRHDNDVVGDALPKEPRRMFTDAFLAAWDAGEAHWLRSALERNEVYRWAPRAPMRLYYGERDEDVSPDDTRRAAVEMRRRGGDAQAISVGAYEHAESAFQALADIRAWFDARNPPREGGRADAMADDS
jgi:hypothetical protein